VTGTCTSRATLRVLGAVKGAILRKLIGNLKGLIPEEMLFGLMSQLPLMLTALIILEPRSERAFEEGSGVLLS
jgi:hypothetical protein